MNILVSSNIEAQEYTFKYDIAKDFAVISISDNDNSVNALNTENNHLKGVLYLSFTDYEEETRHCNLISKEDGVKIRQFVDTYKDSVETIIVHCDAGISRSPGVAAALCRYLGKDEMWVFTNANYKPNMLCYKTVLRACGISVTNKVIEELKEINNIVRSKFCCNFQYERKYSIKYARKTKNY